MEGRAAAASTGAAAAIDEEAAPEGPAAGRAIDAAESWACGQAASRTAPPRAKRPARAAAATIAPFGLRGMPAAVTETAAALCDKATGPKGALGTPWLAVATALGGVAAEMRAGVRAATAARVAAIAALSPKFGVTLSMRAAVDGWAGEDGEPGGAVERAGPALAAVRSVSMSSCADCHRRSASRAHVL
jgi:hypothetical protein